MDVSVVLTLVQTILQLLESPISEEIKLFWGFDSELEKLKNTMSTIQDVLTRVEILESQPNSTNNPKVTLERLEDAVYEADDLFDEVATVAHLKGLMPGNKLSKEVRLFFSRFNQLSHTFTMSREIRKIRGILDDIAKDHHDFGKMVPSSCHHNVEGVSNIGSSRQTGSFVAEEDIIGRDEDKLIVKNFLLDTSLDDTISFVSIVGIGGLGKTALVQSVSRDDTIKAAFSPKMWVCVSDDFNVKSLLEKILTSSTNKTYSGLSMDQLQTQVLQQLHGKKYLLVLDDVWNEDGLIEWDELKRILVQGGKGSRIIVTTRTKRVAEVAGSHRTHILNGLSDDDSWKLFEKMTLKQQDQMEPHLVLIGKDIVRKCSKVPLAIRFVGSLLQGQDEREWERLNKNDLAQIKQDEINGIISVLKISYNHLPPHLKSCFSYCAVFPKDYRFTKEELIYLWMAQGFVRGLELEDLAEDCFRKLLQMCFFQDVVYKDETTGNIFSCKMHDLVHDLAIKVSGVKFESPVNKISFLRDKKTRHIFIDETLVKMEEDVEWYPGKIKKVRTCIVRLTHLSKIDHVQLPFKMKNLRALQLRQKDLYAKIELLPSMIGEMLHLRYLDLSCNYELSKLPNSITQLYNLQTLKLNWCSGLKELPRDLSKLVNLRHLDVEACPLRHMPGRMNNMKCLRKLTMFVVGDDVRKKAGDVGKLEDIKDLNNLTDSIKIEIKDGWRIYDAEKVKEGGYLIHKSLLNKIIIDWDEEWSHDDKDAEALLQGLQPHPNIKKLKLGYYPGVGFPRWGNYSSMNLAEIFLYNCRRLESLPLLSQLRHLKVLGLCGLTKLEYVESSSSSSSSNSRNGDNELVFFPVLTELTLWDLPELKGWWKESTSTAREGGEIARGDVNLQSNNKNNELPELELEDNGNGNGCDDDEEMHMPWKWVAPTLRHLTLLELDKMVMKMKMPKGIQHLTSLVELWIDFPNSEEIPGWIGCLSSLQNLHIKNCSRVKSLPEEMRHLTCLTHLSLWDCSEELKERCKNPTGVDWPKIKHIPSFHC